MKRVAVLGCTGSIGQQALDVIRMHSDNFTVAALVAGSNDELLAKQMQEFRPAFVGIREDRQASRLKDVIPSSAYVEAGADAACIAATLPEVDIVINGISGFAGMRPLISALEANKTVALANKESIVCGHQVVNRALEKGGRILPVDSEQSAIFQCLAAGEHSEISTLILTASGGPFFRYSKEELKNVTPLQALRHPTWNMGKNITLDSATLFNKGLEIMEASYLFDIPGDAIKVLVHPQSVVHSMVEFRDGSTMAQMGVPDMRGAIQYALTYPKRIPAVIDRLDLAALGKLEFFKPDTACFPALDLAYEALRDGNTLPIAYNGAKEQASSYFMENKISFTDIARLVEYAMAHIFKGAADTVEEIIAADAEARRLVRDFI